MPLFIVATPIGNLKDITIRAIEVLKKSDIILCESEERYKILSTSLKLGIKKHITYREENKKRVTPQILEFIKQGLSVSLISDAGMPSVSDPGAYLVDIVLKNNLPISSVPGPTALSTAIAMCGFDARDVVFLGFLPRNKGEIEEILEFYRERDSIIVFYESPERILNTLEIIARLDPMATVFIGREMTKKYEEFLRDNVKNLYDLLNRRPIKGEITVVLKLSEAKSKNVYDPKLLKILLKENLGTKTIARILSDYYSLSCRSVYNELIKKRD